MELPKARKLNEKLAKTNQEMVSMVIKAKNKASTENGVRGVIDCVGICATNAKILVKASQKMQACCGHMN